MKRLSVANPDIKNKTRIMKCNKGAVLILVAVSLFALIGLAALAIDIGHLLLVRGELQNAADSGALAGAQVLYSFNGTVPSINTASNTTAWQLAKDHLSDLKIVDVNPDEVERGHWCFSCIDVETGKKGVFTANPSTNIVDLVGKTTAELDVDTNFINAVRVYARRSDTPSPAFFARIFGFQDFLMSAHAVAYIGFAGRLNPLEADEPIAICQQAILLNDEYVCNVGRMLSDNGDTAGWTNFEQPSECKGAVGDKEVGDAICKGNKTPIIFGNPMVATNGVQSNNFTALRECWSPDLKGGKKAYPDRTTSWTITLPVIDCGDSNKVTSCRDVVGAVNVQVVWITKSGNDPSYEQVPVKMDDWTAPYTPNTEANRKLNWNDFVDHFNLRLPADSGHINGQPAYWNNVYGSNTYGYGQKTVYFKPSCTIHEPTGTTGGKNFGILAKIPGLVK
jgi:hypothetical protein